MIKPGRCIWVSLPHATFGLIVSGGKIVDAAPIGRRYIGQHEREVARQLRQAGAAFQDVQPSEKSQPWTR